jgi:hypothetical protein
LKANFRKAFKKTLLIMKIAGKNLVSYGSSSIFLTDINFKVCLDCYMADLKISLVMQVVDLSSFDWNFIAAGIAKSLGEPKF